MWTQGLQNHQPHNVLIEDYEEVGGQILKGRNLAASSQSTCIPDLEVCVNGPSSACCTRRESS